MLEGAVGGVSLYGKTGIQRHLHIRLSNLTEAFGRMVVFERSQKEEVEGKPGKKKIGCSGKL